MESQPRGHLCKRRNNSARAGQSIWLDNITRDLLATGTLEQYIRDLSVTGLTSNPTIFDKALRHGSLLRCQPARAGATGRLPRGAVLRAGARGHHPRRGSVPPDPRAHRRGRRLGVSRSVAAARCRREIDAGRGEGSARAGQAPESVHQDSRHAATGSRRSKRRSLRESRST